MSESVFMPTHTCFDDALDYLEKRIHAEADPRVLNGRLFVVHAICLAPDGPKKGEPFAHAWVEERINPESPLYPAGEGRWLVWETYLLHGKRVNMGVTLESHRAALQVVKSTTYSLAQVSAENKKHGTYGPWEPEYEALCGGGEVFQ